MTIYIIDGADLGKLIGSIKGREENRTDWDQRITTLRIEPRRDGVAIKLNGGEWSPTIGRVENADAVPGDEWEERNNSALRALVRIEHEENGS
jgi:hypothetical protein